MHQTDIARFFTRPVCVRFRDQQGNVTTEFGTCIIINSDGWILSARHVIFPEKGEITYRWFGFRGLDIEDPFRSTNDLAFAKLKQFDPTLIQSFPLFGRPEFLKPETPLFHAGSLIPPETDLTKLSLDKSGNLVYPGIFSIQPSRFVDTVWSRRPNDETGIFEGRYIRTSSPIVRGHSAGPLIDSNAHVYGVLSSTGDVHHLGMSIETEVIRKGMDALSIKYDTL